MAALHESFFLYSVLREGDSPLPTPNLIATWTMYGQIIFLAPEAFLKARGFYTVQDTELLQFSSTFPDLSSFK